jgi:hypothetical protein
MRLLVLAACVHYVHPSVPVEPAQRDIYLCDPRDATGRLRAGARLFAHPASGQLLEAPADGAEVCLIDGAPDFSTAWTRAAVESYETGITFVFAVQTRDLAYITDVYSFAPWTPGGSSGLVLPPGTPVPDPTGASCNTLTVTGYQHPSVCVSRADVAIAYRFTDRDRTSHVGELVRDAVRLYDDSTGAGTPASGEGFDPSVSVVEQSEAFTLVDLHPRVFLTDPVVLRAWVANDDVRVRPRPTPHPVDAFDYVVIPRSQPLPLGTALYPEPFDRPIGFVTRSQSSKSLQVVRVASGWTQVSAPSSVGPIGAWLLGEYSQAQLHPNGKPPVSPGR